VQEEEKEIQEGGLLPAPRLLEILIQWDECLPEKYFRDWFNVLRKTKSGLIGC